MKTVISVEEIGSVGPDEYVYDLETEDGTFMSGQNILLKNTDSCYVRFDIPRDLFPDDISYMREYFRIANQCAEHISSQFKEPIKIVLEKIMRPLFLYEKKKYAYKEWLSPEGPTEGIKYKGLSIIRRDYCSLVQEICNQIFEILMSMKENAIEEAIKFTIESIQGLLDGKVPIEKLILSTALKGTYKIKGKHVVWYSGLCTLHDTIKERGHAKRDPCSKCLICKSKGIECDKCAEAFEYPKDPHIAVAILLRIINPLNCILPPERVPFVYIKNKKRSKYQCDFVVHPQNVNKNDIDYLYYFEHLLLNPIELIFSILDKECGPIEQIYKKLVIAKRNKDNGLKAITDYFKN